MTNERIDTMSNDKDDVMHTRDSWTAFCDGAANEFEWLRSVREWRHKLAYANNCVVYLREEGVSGTRLSNEVAMHISYEIFVTWNCTLCGYACCDGLDGCDYDVADLTPPRVRALAEYMIAAARRKVPLKNDKPEWEWSLWDC